MPRASREQAAANRQAIEEVSARLFREQGIDGVSVADLMAAAGLTHGGFYRHFESKEALAAVACEQAFVQSAQRRDRWMKDAADGAAALAEFTDRYLSQRHRDDAGRGCPAAALVADIGRQPAAAPVRHTYVAGVRAMADNLARLLAAAERTGSPTVEAAAPHEADPPHLAEPAQAAESVDPALHGAALVRMATMVGAVMLARATKGDPLSAEILAAARAALDVPPPAPAPPALHSSRNRSPS